MQAVAHGLEPLVLTTGAPIWAEGEGRPAPVEEGPDARVGPGAWKPDAAAYGRFATALARRYSGAFKPAGAASPLPRVRRFQAWNEPNLNSYLAPQWERTTSGYRAFSPGRYRELLKHLEALGFEAKETDPPVTDPEDRSKNVLEGKLPGGAVGKVLAHDAVAPLLLVPAGFELPKDGSAPVLVQLELVSGYAPASQLELANQVVALLEYFGFRESVGYDRRGHSGGESEPRPGQAVTNIAVRRCASAGSSPRPCRP